MKSIAFGPRAKARDWMGAAIFAGSKEPAPPTEVGGFHRSFAQHIYETRSSEFTAKAAITIRSDSQFVVEQVNGRWKVRESGLKSICADCQAHVRTLVNQGHSVSLIHIRREENREADKLCNQALDAVFG